jgi:hypothetical protein
MQIVTILNSAVGIGLRGVSEWVVCGGVVCDISWGDAIYAYQVPVHVNAMTTRQGHEGKKLLSWG